MFCGLQAFYNWEVAQDVKNYLTVSRMEERPGNTGTD